MKPIFLIVGAVFIILISILVKCMIDHSKLSLQHAIVSKHVEIICSSAKVALTLEPEQAIKQLEFIVTYYPSGSRLETGSESEKIVETVRKMAIASIISYLKRTTGKDFGDTAEKWINGLNTEK